MRKSISEILFIILITMLIASVSGCSMKPLSTSDLAKKSREILIDQIKNGPRNTRQAIVKLTGGMVEQEAVPLLQTSLKDPDQGIVKDTLEKLIEIKNPLALPVKREELADRFNADLISTLIDLGAKDLDANIESGLTSTNPTSRARAVELLAKYKGKEAEERIRTFLNDEIPVIGMKAKIALAEMGDTEALKGLDVYLNSGNDIIQLATVNLIREKELKEYRDKLLEFAKVGQGILAQEALRVLYKWDDPEAREMVKYEMAKSIEVLKYPLLKDVEEKKDKEMVPSLRKAMASSTPNERYSAARVAVTVDPENTQDVLDFILKGMEVEDPAVREQVAISLSQLPDIPRVKNQLETKGLTDKNPKIVNASIISLGKVGDSESIARLAPLLKSDDSEIRVTAAAAIINIINRKSLAGKAEKLNDSKQSDKSGENEKSE